MAEDPKDDPGVAPDEDVEDVEEDPMEIPAVNMFELLAKESLPDELPKEGLGVTKGSGFCEKDDPEEEDTNEGSEEKDEDAKSMTGEEGDP